MRVRGGGVCVGPFVGTTRRVLQRSLFQLLTHSRIRLYVHVDTYVYTCQYVYPPIFSFRLRGVFPFPLSVRVTTFVYAHASLAYRIQLLAWAWKALKRLAAFSLPIPEILVAIAPNVLNNQVSDPHCMADLARKTDALEKRKDTDGENGEAEDDGEIMAKQRRDDNLVK